MASFHSWAEGTGSSSFQNAAGVLLAQSDAEVTARIAWSVDDVTGKHPYHQQWSLGKRRGDRRGNHHLRAGLPHRGVPGQTAAVWPSVTRRPAWPRTTRARRDSGSKPTPTLNRPSQHGPNRPAAWPRTGRPAAVAP